MAEKGVEEQVLAMERLQVNYYYCDTCHYCFSAEKFPDRCPDCGAIEYNGHAAVRQATDAEVKELLKIRAEDND